VYGFGRCPCNRYYDCNSNKSDFQSWVTEEMLGKNGGHPFETETFLRKEWATQGYIKLYEPPCFDLDELLEEVEAQFGPQAAREVADTLQPDAVIRRVQKTRTITGLVMSMIIGGILFLMLLRKLYVFVQVEERFGRTCRWLFERMHGVGKLMAQHHPPWYVALAVLTMAATPLLIAETQNTYGGYDYMPYAVIFTTEFMRFGCSMALFLRDVPAQARNKTLLSMTWRYAIKWAIPGFIHAVNNYLAFVVLREVNSVRFQVLSSLKFVFTALLFRWALKHHLSDDQWLAIVLMVAGTAALQVCAWDEQGDPIPINAIVWACISCLLESIAHIYSEVLLKKYNTTHSIHAQCILLWFWSAIFSGVLLVRRYPGCFVAGGMFTGFSSWVLIMIANQVCVGLLTNVILKYQDNLVRIFAQAGAGAATVLLQSVCGLAPLRATEIFAAVIIGCAVILYSRREFRKRINEIRLHGVRPRAPCSPPELELDADKPLPSTFSPLTPTPLTPGRTQSVGTGMSAMHEFTLNAPLADSPAHRRTNSLPPSFASFGEHIVINRLDLEPRVDERA